MTKKQKTINNYILTGLIILLCNLLFGIIGLVVMVSDFHIAVPIIIGIISSTFSLIYCFQKGGRCGEKDYKETLKLLQKSSQNPFAIADINIFKGLFNLISFVAPLFISLLLGIIINNNFLHNICYFVFLNVSIIFFETGFVSIDPITWWSMLIYLPYIIITCAVFIAGYIIKIERLKNRQREIAGEIRMFNN